ncbi:cadherin-like domain-containing protein [Granulosicoccus antarcticus]|uniref:Putative outer membrane protein pmp20 n=1 Tax=Granulosicoccus antarcticus IMCC3135 TaxID=1192854 RepID=A0A2Z2P3W3_9GAMM|nr:cadherin-like domain-containing protein [Granulosicoccus antarcticus]ASJ75347.1 putative outer membrane protein pmp20 [Granulosicoccus antarcticus IMCC3135]
MKRRSQHQGKLARKPIVDVLEPRLLYSADALSGLLPLLFDEGEENDDHYLIPIELPSPQIESINHIIFLDESVPSGQSLTATLDDAHTRIVTINSQDDGLLLISQTLAEYDSLSSVQIISHGEPGQLQLGAVRVDEATLIANQVAVSRWANALSEDADFLLMGCDVAAGPEGLRFVDELARLSGADVAASIDITGHDSLGGDWDLEYHNGTIETAFALDDDAQSQWTHSLGTIVVDTLVDEFDIAAGVTLDELLVLQSNGEIVSLREAVYAANQGASGVDTIILGSGNYQLSITGSDDDAQVGDLDIADDIIITGEGLDNTHIQISEVGERVVDVFDSTLTMDGLKITGGSALGDGGGIRAQGSSQIILTGVEISGNQANGNGGGIYASSSVSAQLGKITGNSSNGGGGGIYSTSGATSLSNMEVSGNTSVGNGGGVLAQDVIVIDSGVTGNTSSNANGGGLYVTGTLELTNFMVKDNTAQTSGGGVYVVDTFTIDSGQFNNNRSITEKGGGLYSLETGLISDTDFILNKAEQEGGGILASKAVDISNSGFQYNDAVKDGGAIFANESLTVTDSGFGSNTSAANGGAVYVNTALIIERSSFRLNTASSGEGGAVYHNDNTSITVTSSTFSGNSADRAGAIHSGGAGTIRGSTFVENDASTAFTVIEGTGGFISVISSIFYNNPATDAGITIFSDGTVVTGGYNLLDFNSGSETDLNNIDPLLGAYDASSGRVGGYTLLPGSPAINAGNADASQTTDGQGVVLDEFADIGAAEYSSNDSVIFWSDSNGAIYRSNTDFTNVQLFISGRTDPHSLSVNLDDGRLYWVEQGGTTIVSAALGDPGTVTTFLTGLVNARSLAVDAANRHVYVAFEGGTGRINRYDLDGGGLLETVVSSGISDPKDLAFDGNRLYWIEGNSTVLTQSVRSTDLAGGDLQIHETDTGLANIALNADSTYIYYAEKTSDSIARIDTSTETTTLHATLPDLDPGEVRVDQSTGNVIFSSDVSNRIVTLSVSDWSELAGYSHPQDVIEIATTSTTVASAMPELNVNAGLTVLEGSLATIDSSVLEVIDSDTDASNIVYTLLNTPLNGNLIVNGDSSAVSFTEAQLQDSNIVIAYQHDGSETLTESLQFEVSDGSNTTDPFTFDIGIEPDNDTPTLVITGAPFTVSEGDELTVDQALLLSSDVDSPTTDYLYTVSAQQNGQLKYQSTLLSDGETFSYQQLSSGQFTFLHDGSETTTASFVVELSDGTATTAAQIVSIAVDPVNDAPTLSIVGAPFNVAEGNELLLGETVLVSNDVDNLTTDYLYTVSAQQNGQIKYQSTLLSDGETFTHQQLSSGQFTFLHDGSETTTASFIVELSDGTASTVAQTVSIAVNPVNDAPTLSIVGAPFNVAEGNELLLGETVLVSGDVDNLATDYLYTVSAQQNGQIKYQSTLLSDGETFTYQQLSSGQFTFLHDGSETTAASFIVELSDGSATTAAQTVSITVDPVNDAPTLSIVGAPFNVAEGNELLLGETVLVSGDVDNLSTDYLYIVSAQQNGQLKYQNTLLSDGEKFTYQQLSSGQLTFLHDSGETTTASFTIVLTDGTATTVAQTVSIAVNPVNDAPTLSIVGAPFNVAEGNELLLSESVLVSGDVDNLTIDYLYTVSAQQNGQIKYQSTLLSDGETFTHQQLSSGQFTFLHDGSETTAASFIVELSDGSATTAAQTVSITVDPVNDAPTLSIVGAPFNVAEGNELLLGETVLVSGDVDNLSTDYLYIVSAQQNGQLKYQNSLLSDGETFTYQQLSSGQLTFLHDGSETTTASFVVELSDGTATTAAQIVSIAVDPVNDAPTLSIVGAPFNVAEGNELLLGETVLVSNDVDNLTTDYLYTVSAQQNGQIKYQSTLLSDGETFTYQQLSSGQLTFIHDGSETTTASFTIILSDGTATTAAQTVSITVDPVDDAPTLSIVGAPFNVAEGNELLLSETILLSDDVDNLNTDYLYTVSAQQNGQIKYQSTLLSDGETFTYQQLSSGQFTFLHDGSETTAASFIVELSDGSATTAAQTVSITVDPVNDAPTLSIVGASFNVAEGNELLLSETILLSDDVDNLNTDYLYTVSAQQNGQLKYQSTLLSDGETFTYQQLSSSELTFLHDGSEATTASFIVELSDGTATTTAQTVSIAVNPVNDVPTLSIVGAPFNVAEGNELLLSESVLVSGDVDNLTTDYLYTVSAQQNGQIKYQSTLLSDGETFTYQQLSSGQFTFLHDGSETTAASFIVELSDGSATTAAQTVSITVDPVNDAPTLSIVGAPFNVAEGNELLLSETILLSDDVDNLNTDYLYTVSAQQNGQLKYQSTLLSDGETFTYQQLSSSELTFLHDGSEATTASFIVELSDGTATTAAQIVSIAADPVNDAPTLSIAGAPFNVAEGESFPVSEIILLSDDVDNLSADYLYTVSAQQNGQLQYQGTFLSDGDTFTYQQLTSAQLEFLHDGSETTAASFTVVLSDGITSTVEQIVSMGVSPVNDAPTLSIVGAPFTVQEGEAFELSEAMLLSDDVDNPTADYLYTVSAQNNGQLQYQDTLLSDGDTFTYQQLVSASLYFRHDGSESATSSVTLSVSDGSRASNSVTLNIDIEAVDDAPVWSAPSSVLQVQEGGVTVLDTQLVAATDSDNAQSEFIYRLVGNSEQGALELSGNVLSEGDTFTQSQLESGAVLYRQDGSETRSDSISLLAFNQNGSAQAQTIDIAISEQNDVPQLSVNVDAVAENIAGAALGTVSVSDDDMGDSVVLTVDDARFEIIGNMLVLKAEQSLDHESEPILTLNVSATDSRGAVTSVQVIIDVLDRNDAPQLAFVPGPTAGDGYQLPSDLFVDQDGDFMGLSVTQADGKSLPEWLLFDQSRRQFSVADAEAASEQLDVLISAEDGRGGEISTVMSLLFDPPLAAAEPVVPALPEIELLQAPIVSLRTEQEPLSSNESQSTESQAVESPEESLSDDPSAVESPFIPTVDVQALIESVPRAGFLELAVLGQDVLNSEKESVVRTTENDIDSFDLADLLRLPSSNFSVQSDLFDDAFTKQKDVMEEQASLMQVLMGKSAGVTTGLSAGYLLWLIRGGTLMGSVLSSLPAWRFVDPLPVLDSLGGGVDNDDESLESMVNADGDADANHENVVPPHNIPGHDSSPIDDASRGRG